MRIAIAEDEQLYAEQLQMHLRHFAQESGEPIEVQRFVNGAELVERYRGNWDVLLLDVDMPGMNGLDAARSIRLFDPDVLILFITNLAQYAIRGYEVNALDYLLKPVSYYDLSMKMNAALRILRRNEEQFLLIAQDGGVTRLAISRLYYVEAFGHQLHYHTAQGKLVSTTVKTLSALEKETETFFRCHKGYLVNLRYVDEVRGSTLVVAGEELPVSRNRKKALLQALLEFAKGGRNR